MIESVEAIRGCLIRRFELTVNVATTYKYQYSERPVESCSRSDVQTIFQDPSAWLKHLGSLKCHLMSYIYIYIYIDFQYKLR